MKYKTAVYHSGESMIVRLFGMDDTSVSDGSYPNNELGFLCFRDIHKWLVSGFVDERLASTSEEVDQLVYRISEEVLDLDDCLSLNVSVIKVKHTLFANGEEDDRFV